MKSLIIKLGVVLFSAILSVNTSATELPKSGISSAERIVVEFYHKIFVEGANKGADVQNIAERYVHPDYIQHNPFVATGRAPFIKAATSWMKNRTDNRKTEIKRVITSGDYVVVHVHAYDTKSDKPGRAGVDIFRVENGKIIEHWDVWQTIPENMPHQNGML